MSNEEPEVELPDLPTLEAAEIAAKHVFDGLRKKARALHKTPTSFRSHSARDMREINSGIQEYLELHEKIQKFKIAQVQATSTPELISQFMKLYQQLLPAISPVSTTESPDIAIEGAV